MTSYSKLAIIACGHGEGNTPINAFDCALLNAHIGNLNLLKISSVLPPKYRVVDVAEIDSEVVLPPGSVIPAVFTYCVSSIPGTEISSAVAVAVPEDENLNGMIFETNNTGVPDRDVFESVKEMACEAMQIRGYGIKEIIVRSAMYRPMSRYACTVAAVLLYDRNRI